MAYTITQKPTTPNAAYTRLLYVVSGSTNTNKPLFQYVMDVYESGSNELIKRTTQTVNPAGVSVFDPARIIQGRLSEDDSWKISSLTAFDSSSKTFTLNFGETYAASISSSAVIIEGISNTNIEVFRGVVEPNNGISYNWQSSSYAVLSNMPATMSMQSDDFGTVSVYNNDVTYVSQSFYSASLVGDFLVENKNYSVSDNFSSIPISSSANYWNYVNVNVSSSLGIESYRYEVSDDTCREKTRFAFINKLGTWDYYNNYNPVRQVMQIEREQYTAPRVDYSSLSSLYNIERRGVTDYHNSTEDEFTVDTDLLDKTNANWIEELIESPSVYIQRNGEFIPIVITDSSYTANTNQARQKQFQYTINFKPSNQPFGTWIPEYVSVPQIDNTGVPNNIVAYTPSLILSQSAVLSGSIGSSGSAALTEIGFVYNSASLDIPVKGGTGVTTVIVTPPQEGLFSSSISGLNALSTYQYRAYAENSLGTSYSNNVTWTSGKAPFDPTLDGALTSQLWAWWDFSDTGSMVLDGNQPTEVQSKGTYTGSIYYQNRGSLLTGSVEFNSNGYTSISGGLGYGMGTTTTDDWLVFESGSSFTTITVAQDFEGTHVSGENPPEIYYQPTILTPSSRRQYTNLQLGGFRNNADPFDTGSSRLQYYLSTETANNGISSSAQAYDFDVNKSRTIIYNYSGSNGTDIWESRFMRSEFNLGTQDSNITVGRNSSNSLIFNNDQHSTTNNGVGFYLRSNSATNKLNVSQVLIYTGSLSDSQIDNVIDNLKNSSNITFGDEINAVNN